MVAETAHEVHHTIKQYWKIARSIFHEYHCDTIGKYIIIIGKAEHFSQWPLGILITIFLHR